MKGFQKIHCTVDKCVHNFKDDCCCKLDSIHVSPCIAIKKTGNTSEEETACVSYEEHPLNKL